MNRKMAMQNRPSMAGFTLIELLVVVMVIGILAAVAIPQYFKIVERGRYTDAANTVGNIIDAEERYVARNSIYTDDFCNLDIQLTQFDGSAFLCGSSANGQLRNYIVQISAVRGATNYDVTVQRTGNSPARYGAYQFVYTCPGTDCAPTPKDMACAAGGSAGAKTSVCYNEILP